MPKIMSQALPALAELHEIVAPSSWQRIDFISDLHLAETATATFAAWRTYLLGTMADAVFILGDLFETWVGDDARHGGFEKRGADVLTEAAARRPLFFMVGNRDFLLGAEMLASCGVAPLPDPSLLIAFHQRTLLTHGDAWCIGDLPYQQFRAQVRNPAWQANVLARPLAERRAMARHLRSESESRATQQSGAWVDVDTTTAVSFMTRRGANTLVHGHTHHPSTDVLASGFQRHVLSDWDLDHGSNHRAEVLRFEAGRWRRMPPTEAVAGFSR